MNNEDDSAAPAEETPIILRHAERGAMEVVIGDWVYVRISYDYRYTDNAHREWLAREIVKLLRPNGIRHKDQKHHDHA